MAGGDQSSLAMYGREMTAKLTGKNLSEIEKLPAPRSRLKCEILLVLVSTMRELERRRFADVHYVGLAAMIRQPSFMRFLWFSAE